MLSQEISGHYISVVVMLMIVLLGEALLCCVAKTLSGYGGIKVKVCVCVCVCVKVKSGEHHISEPRCVHN